MFNSSQGIVSRFAYHFDQYGIYKLRVAETSSSVTCIKEGNNEILALLISILLLVSSVVLWKVITNLYKRWKTHNRRAESVRSDLIGCAGHQQVDDTLPGNVGSHEDNEGHVPAADVPLLSSSNAAHQPRLKSLDTFRGIAIALMIFVNYGGGEYYFFRHSPWNGLTVADLVFPWFLWIMGVSLSISLNRQVGYTTPIRIIWKILARSANLVILGIILNSLKSSFNSLTTLRIPGVLQRIGVSYMVLGVGEVICWYCPWPVQTLMWTDIISSPGQWIIAVLLGLLHILITFLVPAPGCPEGYVGPGGLHINSSYFNCTGGIAGYIDRMVFGPLHIYQHPTSEAIFDSNLPFDPEGILGTLTACITVYLGACVGRSFCYLCGHIGRILNWIAWATVMGILGGLLCSWSKEDGIIPVNKNLWSLSFVMVTASFALILFTVCYTVIDKQDWWNGSPFLYAGMNPILLYVGHEITKKTFPWSWSLVSQTHKAYLAINLWGTSLWLGIAYWLHRKKLYLTV